MLSKKEVIIFAIALFIVILLCSVANILNRFPNNKTGNRAEMLQTDEVNVESEHLPVSERYRWEKITIDGMEYLFVNSKDMNVAPFCINLTNEKLLNQYLKKELNR